MHVERLFLGIYIQPIHQIKCLTSWLAEQSSFHVRFCKKNYIKIKQKLDRRYSWSRNPPNEEQFAATQGAPPPCQVPSMSVSSLNTYIYLQIYIHIYLWHVSHVHCFFEDVKQNFIFKFALHRASLPKWRPLSQVMAKACSITIGWKVKSVGCVTVPIMHSTRLLMPLKKIKRSNSFFAWE